MKLFLIPGLAYDGRIFNHLNLKSCNRTVIEWIEPEVSETLQNYVCRLFPRNIHPDEKVVIIGHSFGAIIAQEIACQFKVDKLILISGIKHHQELPYYFKALFHLRLTQLFTKKRCLMFVNMWAKFQKKEKQPYIQLVKDMIEKQSDHYLQWAIHALITWRRPQLPKETCVVHIHGSHDQTFPIKYILEPKMVIPDGKHHMIWKLHEKMNALIQKELDA